MKPLPILRGRSLRPLCAATLLIVSCRIGAADDWPTFQHDSARSAQTAEPLELPLAETWVYRSAYRPQPAWTSAAKWDGWNKIRDLKDRMIFDSAFQVAAAGDAVYFGSQVDDQVYCLDATTGDVRWSFFTEGPLRLAPAVAGGRVYAGSDDGCVYCLAADDGRLLWKHRPGPDDRRVAGNGRIISPWAIRSGVVPMGDTVYACAGVFPSETVFLCALRADSGEELWKTEVHDLPVQGYMLASQTRLYVTTGRSRPVVFDRATGERLFEIKGGSTGGTYALLTGDTLLFGPGKTGEVSIHASRKEDHLASFSGNHMIVTPGASYLHTDTGLSALDRFKYIRLYGERRQRQSRKTDLAKLLKTTKPENSADTERIRDEMEQIDAQIDLLSKQLQRCHRWQVDCDLSLSLVLAGDTLFAGGAGRVGAFHAADGERVWDAPVSGNAYGLAVANGRLLVSTDDGSIHCFAPEAAGRSGPPPTAQIEEFQPATQTSPQPSPATRPPAGPRNDVPSITVDRIGDQDAVAVQAAVAPVHGPFIEFVRPAAIRVEWSTDSPATTELDIGPVAADTIRSEIGMPETHTTEHAVILEGIERKTIYRLRVAGSGEDGSRFATPWYQFDSTFNYLPVAGGTWRSDAADPQPADAVHNLAARIVAEAGCDKGYALVLGTDNIGLVRALAELTDLQIVVAEEDAELATAARTRLDTWGLYGTRATVIHCKLDALPLGPYVANLIVCGTSRSAEPASGAPAGEISGRFDPLYRMLRPAGGVICCVHQPTSKGGTRLTKPQLDNWIGAADLAAGSSRIVDQQGLFWMHRRGKLPGAGEWTHQYAGPDNSACSQDELVRGGLSVLWWGRPGPRPMPDRGPRNPAPVSANGRLYIQGDRTLFGLDAYNGTILWAKQIPTMRRANMPRDCSNMVATDDRLYVIVGDRCVGFDGRTGRREQNLPVPALAGHQPRDWGYLAAVGDRLLGSSTKRDARYLGDDGEWYEDDQQEAIARVTSDSLFAVDRHTGRLQWRYERGAILNSTITTSDGLVHFIESRNPPAIESPSSRLLEPVQREQHLVALEMSTGRVRWETPFDFSQCHFMTYMSYGNDTLTVVGTDAEKTYHIYAFDSRTGYNIWTQEAKAQKTHHSGHLAHPTIIGDRLYVNKHTYDLLTGNVLDVDEFDWHGCGVMSASRHTIFHRFEYHGMLDLETNERTEFLGIRSGCWLSLIPSGGVLLAPESSSGCSCSHSIQTTLAYVPTAVVTGESMKAGSSSNRPADLSP